MPEHLWSAGEARRLLEEGNRRFAHDDLALIDAGREKRKHLLINGQKPFALIVGCSDSRVPPEIIFNCSLGDLFVIRTAGNVVDDVALGSIEYAVAHLHVPLAVILGHESCGAVKAALEARHTNTKMSGNFDAIIDKIKPSVQTQESETGSSSLMDFCVDKNVLAMCRELTSRSTLISSLIEDGLLTVLGAKYCLETGEVVFFDDKKGE